MRGYLDLLSNIFVIHELGPGTHAKLLIMSRDFERAIPSEPYRGRGPRAAPDGLATASAVMNWLVVMPVAPYQVHV